MGIIKTYNKEFATNELGILVQENLCNIKDFVTITQIKTQINFKSKFLLKKFLILTFAIGVYYGFVERDFLKRLYLFGF